MGAPAGGGGCIMPPGMSAATGMAAPPMAMPIGMAATGMAMPMPMPMPTGTVAACTATGAGAAITTCAPHHRFNSS